MQKDEFLTALDHALRFTRLHGWVDQTRDEILAVWKFFLESPDQQKGFRQSVLQKLDASVSTEEKLLCLIFLRYLELPATEIADLFLRYLDGKLGKRDAVTIQRYFFETRSPIPDEFSREITDRVFLTNQRAIYRAMQIQSFESEFDAANNVLFLVQLLCRNDLYEQNRAMVYLLLSRIECPIPESIETMVREAMTHLRDVISEVEARQESVLSDAHPQGQTSAQYHWERPAAPEPGPTSDRPVRHPQPEATQTAPTLESRPAPPSKPAAPRVVQPAAASLSSQPLPETLTAADPPASVQDTTRKRQPPAALSIPAGSFNSRSETEETSAAAPAAKSRPSPTKTAAPASQVSAPERGELIRDPVPASPEPRSVDRFKISFNRHSDELEAVLEVLSTPRKKETPRANPGVENPPAAAEETQPESKTDRPVLWGPWVIGALGLAALVGLIFLLTNQRTAESPSALPPPAPSPPQELPQGSGAIPEEAVAPKPFTLKDRDDQVVWIPGSGDKLWQVYVGLQEGWVEFSGSAALASMEWTQFLAAVQALNVDLVPDLIQPGQEIRLR